MRLFVSKLKNFAGSVRRNGAILTIKLYYRRLHEIIVEKRLGIRTADRIDLDELGLEHEERMPHGPTSYFEFRALENFIRPTEANEVFLDYGAGLGRAVILASMLPFQRVIGIELSSALAERARENLQRVRGRLVCKNVDIHNVDATDFDVPLEVTRIYFANPFKGEILEQVLKRIKHSSQKRRRPIKIICNHPLDSAFEHQICQIEWLELEHRVQLNEGMHGRVFAVRLPP
jgi:precorrin-6B methylase 2